MGCAICGQSPCACGIHTPIGASYEEDQRGVSDQQQNSAVQQIAGKLDARDPQQRTTRRLWITKTFSLMEAHGNPRAAMWKLTNDKSFSKAPVNASRRTARGGDLSTCVLAHVAVLAARTEHKPDIGVRLMGMQGNTYNHMGDRYPYVIMGGGQLVSYGKKGLTIFMPKKLIGTVFFSSYAGLTESSIDEGVQHLDNEHTMVPRDNIVMHVLRLNQYGLPFDLNQMYMRHNRVEMSRKLFEGIKDVVKRKIIAQLPYVNLGHKSFNIIFHRADVAAGDANHYISQDGALGASRNNTQLYEDK